MISSENTIWDLYDAIQRTNGWIVLYYLKHLGKGRAAKSKYIASELNQASRKIVSALIVLQRYGLVKKQLVSYSIYDTYPKHWWFITCEGLSFIQEREKLDSEGHLLTMQKLDWQ